MKITPSSKQLKIDNNSNNNKNSQLPKINRNIDLKSLKYYQPQFKHQIRSNTQESSKTNRMRIKSIKKKPDFVLDGGNVSYKLPFYDPLTDQNLSSYFSNSYNRKHLERVGIIDKQGNIIPNEKKIFCTQLLNSDISKFMKNEPILPKIQQDQLETDYNNQLNSRQFYSHSRQIQNLRSNRNAQSQQIMLENKQDKIVTRNEMQNFLKNFKNKIQQKYDSSPQQKQDISKKEEPNLINNESTKKEQLQQQENQQIKEEKEKTIIKKDGETK